MNLRLFTIKSIHFSKLIGRLILSAPFLTLSFYCNLIVSIFAFIIYFLEKDINPKINHIIDAFWWSFATTTTVGYGDITPITIPGKLIGICLMIIGVAIFGVYTALFARAILDDEIYMQ